MVTKELKNRTNHISLLDADGKSKIEIQKQKLKAGATSQDIYDCNMAQAGFSNLTVLSNGYINKYAMTLILPQNVLSGVEYVTGCFQATGQTFILSTRSSNGFGGQVYKTINNGTNWTVLSTQTNEYVHNIIKDMNTGDSYGQTLTSTGNALFASSGNDFLSYGGSGYGANYEFAKGNMFINSGGQACFVLKAKPGLEDAEGFEAYWRGSDQHIATSDGSVIQCCCGDAYTEFIYSTDNLVSTVISVPQNGAFSVVAFIQNKVIVWAVKIDGRVFNVVKNANDTYSLYRTAGIVTNNPTGINDLVYVQDIEYVDTNYETVLNIVNAGANFYMLTKDTIWKSTDNTGSAFQEFKTLPNCKTMWCYGDKLSVTAGNEVFAFTLS